MSIGSENQLEIKKKIQLNTAYAFFYLILLLKKFLRCTDVRPVVDPIHNSCRDYSSIQASHQPQIVILMKAK